MKISRIIITTECILHCEYCCNKLPEIQNSFKMITLEQFVNMDYDVVNITGGEPMLSPRKVNYLVNKLSLKHKKPLIYLYTTGLVWDDNINYWIKNLDGVNIGCHDNFRFAYEGAKEWKRYVKNIRFHIEENKITKIQKELLEKNGLDLVEWKMNECNNTKEDRWII